MRRERQQRPHYSLGQYVTSVPSFALIPIVRTNSTRITDKTVNGGWLQRRSAPGTCFLSGEIIFASCWFGNVRGTENDNLFVAFYGRGFENEPMGDFDNIGFIRNIGMSHSILYMTE